MTEAEIVEIFELCSVKPGYLEHPAWPAFRARMVGRQYGADALTQAWFWFRIGWDAEDAVSPA